MTGTMLRATSFLSAAAILAACGATPTATISTPAPTTAPAAADNLTGLGATDTAFNANHTYGSLGTIATPGTVYGPCFTRKDDGSKDCMFKAVRHGDGRVLAFSLDFQSDTPLAVAESDVIRQLPRDATYGPLMVQTHCAVWNFMSPTLASLLGTPPIGDKTGMVGVEFDSGPAASDPTVNTYNTNSVTRAIMSTTADLSGTAC